MNHHFPQNIHFIWFQGFNDVTFPKKSNEYIESWQKLNPDWKIFKWDENSLAEFISTKYPQYYGCWKNLDKVIKKCDFARWLLVHYYGGLYVDCDSIPSKPLNDFLNSNKIYYSDYKKIIKGNPWFNTKFFPKEEHSADFNVNDYKLILPKEWIEKKIEQKRKPVTTITNCFILGLSEQDVYLDYLNYAIEYKDSSVLDSIGTHRLTNFFELMNEKDKKNIFFLSPMYVIWYYWCDWSFDSSIKLIEHQYFTQWGDKTLEHPWKV